MDEQRLSDEKPPATGDTAGDGVVSQDDSQLTTAGILREQIKAIDSVSLTDSLKTVLVSGGIGPFEKDSERGSRYAGIVSSLITDGIRPHILVGGGGTGRGTIGQVLLRQLDRQVEMVRLYDWLSQPELQTDLSGLVSINSLLRHAPRLLIRGIAGSGKTTLLQWIAVRAASKDFPSDLSAWNYVVPFYIRLRQCVETSLPAPEDFPGLVAPAMADLMPKGWCHNLLESGMACVLVDGVDEISENRRPDVERWLSDLVGRFPEARYVVTSRPHAVTEDWLGNLDFVQADLQPMDIPSIHEFIDHWHDAVMEELYEPEEKLELKSLPLKLKAVLRRNRPIRNLATNPLLCAMLCALYRDRKQQLPSDRIELYEAGCYMLLEGREIEQRIELPEYPHLTYRQKRALLEDLAYWMMTNGWSQVERGRAEERLSKRLSNMEGLSEGVQGKEVCRYLVDRSGMIREPVADQVDFAHRTFQEFLAAKAALDEDDVGVLIRNAHDDLWREVIILATGLASTKIRSELINGLLERGFGEPQYRQRLVLLAMAGLETAIDLVPEVRNRIQSQIAEFIPFKSVEQVKSFAAAGDLAVPHLGPHEEHSEEITVACVKALVANGGEQALDVLEKYNSDRRGPVVNELMNGLRVYDRDEYVQRVVSPLLAKQARLELDKLDSFEGFEKLEGLTSLRVLDCSSISSLDPLKGLKGLNELRLFNCKSVRNLQALHNLTNLRVLEIEECPHVQDLRPLIGLANLTALGLTHFRVLADLRPLSNLNSLTELSIKGCKHIRRISPLGTLTELETLNMGGCTQLRDLSPLKELPNLKVVNIEGLPKQALYTWQPRSRVQVTKKGNQTDPNRVDAQTDNPIEAR